MPRARFQTLPMPLVLLLGLALLVACGDDAAEPAGDALTVEAAFVIDAAQGQNELLITVRDADGALVSDATVTVDPQMPMMGHGSSEVAVVTNNGDGTYSAAPVTFTMGGEWVVTVEAVRGDERGSTEVRVTV